MKGLGFYSPWKLKRRLTTVSWKLAWSIKLPGQSLLPIALALAMVSAFVSFCVSQCPLSDVKKARWYLHRQQVAVEERNLGLERLKARLVLALERGLSSLGWTVSTFALCFREGHYLSCKGDCCTNILEGCQNKGSHCLLQNVCILEAWLPIVA